jgi:hypothetical protein
MKGEKRGEEYQTPHVDVTEVAVEAGFQNSPQNDDESTDTTTIRSSEEGY